MQTEKTLVNRLTEALKSTMSADYLIVTSHAAASVEGLSPSRPPDILVVNKAGGRPVLLEVRGSGKGQDLPLSTAHVTQVLRSANAHMNPKIVVVTTSQIKPLLKSALDEQDVTVVKADDFDVMLDNIKSVIRKSEFVKD